MGIIGKIPNNNLVNHQQYTGKEPIMGCLDSNQISAQQLTKAYSSIFGNLLIQIFQLHLSISKYFEGKEIVDQPILFYNQRK